MAFSFVYQQHSDHIMPMSSYLNVSVTPGTYEVTNDEQDPVSHQNILISQSFHGYLSCQALSGFDDPLLKIRQPWTRVGT